MDIRQLQEKGGLVSSSLVKVPVTWERVVDGEPTADTFDVFVKRFTFGSIERMLKIPEGDRSRTAEMICDSIRLGDEGKEKLTYEQAYQLDPSLAKVFADAIREVNELGKTNR